MVNCSMRYSFCTVSKFETIKHAEKNKKRKGGHAHRMYDKYRYLLMCLSVLGVVRYIVKQKTK